jgi:hypothetical protein
LRVSGLKFHSQDFFLNFELKFHHEICIKIFFTQKSEESDQILTQVQQPTINHRKKPKITPIRSIDQHVTSRQLKSIQPAWITINPLNSFVHSRQNTPLSQQLGEAVQKKLPQALLSPSSHHNCEKYHDTKQIVTQKRCDVITKKRELLARLLMRKKISHEIYTNCVRT